MKKTITALVCLFAVLFCMVCVANAESSKNYEVTVVGNCWAANSGYGGSSLYTPYLKLNVKNLGSNSVSRITVKVVFYNEAEKSVWSEESDYLVGSSDDPLRAGYSKTSYVRSSVGYRSKIDAYRLPTITAEVYVNDVLYGEIKVDNTYSANTVSQSLTQASTKTASNTFATDDPYGVVATAAYWNTNTGMNGTKLYTPYMKIRVTNQQTSAASKLQVKVVFINESDNSVWDDNTTYLVGYSDTPLRTGYNKTAYVYADVGYRSKPNTYQLPNVSAQVYVNDVYYGKVTIDKSYTETTTNTVLTRSTAASNESTVEVDKENPYKMTVVCNCWAANSGSFGGSTLYTPYLKVNVLNQSGKPLKSARVKVVFYDEANKVVWSDETAYLVSSSDSPIQHGFSKTAFIRSAVGYSSRIDVSRLPAVTAEVYLDGEYMGEIAITNTYSETTVNQTLKKVEKVQTTEAANAEEPFSVLVTANCWSLNSGYGSSLYTPYLKLKVINQSGKPVENAKVQVIFSNKAEKEVWSDETSYLVSSGDTPLKNGYGKIAFIRSSVGYRSKPSTTYLPDITAQVYINGVLYGEIDVSKTFSESSVSQTLRQPVAASGSAVGSTDGRNFRIEYLSNCWTANTGLTGETLYVPYLKFKVVNQQERADSSVSVHVVYYKESDKLVWSDEESYLVSGSDAPLQPGYSKTAFIESSVGYQSKPSVSSLPSITAEIYIDNELYDVVTIKKEFGN